MDAAPATPLIAPLPEALLACRLAALADETGFAGHVHVADGEQRARRTVAALTALFPDRPAAWLPAWDCLPYDRLSPSAGVMGRRMALLRRLAAGERPIVVATPDALLQLLPPPAVAAAAVRRIVPGAALALDALRAFLDAVGYRIDDRVDEPGEAALRGEVVDLFPADADRPVRIDHDGTRVLALRPYEPASQRSAGALDALELGPASEVILAEGAPRSPGIEHALPRHHGPLAALPALMPEAGLTLDPDAPGRAEAFLEQVADAWETRRALGDPPPPPDRLYWSAAAWADACAARARPLAPARTALPAFRAEPDPPRALRQFLRSRRRAGAAVMLVAPTGRQLARLTQAARIAPANDREPGAHAPLTASVAPLDAGFDDGERILVTAADLFGAPPAEVAATARLPELAALQPGDAVVHAEHGIGRLDGLVRATGAGGADQEWLRLTYAGDARLLVPTDELDCVWRLDAADDAVALDRLDGTAWHDRRNAVARDLAETARRLVALARERTARRAAVLVAPERPYRRFAARFPFTPTPDQQAAIAAVEADLAAGRPMDRLVAGDVGFGKTEVALRAAAITALAGRQVALAAPTTVLVRQHAAAFRRRFAGLGVPVVELSRLTPPAARRTALAQLARGGPAIAIGTSLLAGRTVRLPDLSLVIVDEEQRFGIAQKTRLRTLGRDRHVLTLTATPIPRTLQAALGGLQDLSVIASAPVARQPVRTVLAPLDPALLRAALLREQRRGGQSFVVVPRIADLAPMAARLRSLAPELDLAEAHGRLPAAALDDVMIGFAEGRHDVLLCTDIVEAGLDIPAANTMVIWRPERFGLAELHQLRGRVGRGGARAVCYLLTDPAARLAGTARRRLETLSRHDRLGAGLALSLRDLEARGAGDLLGAEQAGHVRMVGVALYRELMRHALAAARGTPLPERHPCRIELGVAGMLPADYIPEPELRIALYRRIAAPDAAGPPDALRDEIEDRFGPVPEPVDRLLRIAALRRAAERLGIVALEAGPRGIAARFAEPARHPAIGGARWDGDRIVLSRPAADGGARLQLAERFVGVLGRALGRRPARLEL